MPEWVADDSTWAKAKEAALKTYKEGDEEFWPVVTSIYKKMGGKVKHHVKVAKATEIEDAVDTIMASESEIVNASGTSEGVKKGWEMRMRNIDSLQSPRIKGYAWNKSADWGSSTGGTYSPIPLKGGGHVHGVLYNQMISKKEGTLHHYSIHTQHEGKVEHHTFYSREPGVLGKVKEGHFSLEDLRNLQKNSEKFNDQNWLNASEIESEQTMNEPKDFILCKDSGIVLASAKKWTLDEPATFQWMPAGVTTINAHYNGKPIELTVEAGPATAKAVQASYEDWFKVRPKQMPFGCVEHREEEAAIRLPKDVAAFEWKDGDGEVDAGIYCTALPTELGAKNVNGRIHSSWSPSFTTDAEYSKAKEMGGRLVFPKGARGSRDNPAKVTGCAFSVGSLTNKPAFRNISPVRAKEGEIEAVEDQEETPVEASGTSEGVKKSWEHRPHIHKYLQAVLNAHETETRIRQDQDMANSYDRHFDGGEWSDSAHAEMANRRVSKAFKHPALKVHADDLAVLQHEGKPALYALPEKRLHEHANSYHSQLAEHYAKGKNKASDSETSGLDAIYARLAPNNDEVSEIYSRLAEPEDPLQSLYSRFEPVKAEDSTVETGHQLKLECKDCGNMSESGRHGMKVGGSQHLMCPKCGYKTKHTAISYR